MERIGGKMETENENLHRELSDPDKGEQHVYDVTHEGGATQGREREEAELPIGIA